MRPVVVVDNFDSFTWNLVDLVRRGPFQVEVFRNNEVTVNEILALKPVGVLISPGPGRPEDSGISEALLRSLDREVPVLGVCLGHQLLGEMAGMRLQHAAAPVHGKTSLIHHRNTGIFAGLPQPMQVMRYHSLQLAREPWPEEWELPAWTSAGEVVGICHRLRSFAGVQFHPESILTESGEQLLQNWLRGLA